MPTTLVVYNPAAGRRRRRLDEQIQAIISSLSSTGIKTLTAMTAGNGDNQSTLFHGIARPDTVLVCGGDGTINEVLQAMMAAGIEAPIGVIPFGSGNLMAKELAIRGNLEAILRQQPSCRPQKRSVACIERIGTNERRYWLAAAGVGADARVICAVNPNTKAKFGIVAYYAEAARQLVFSPDPFPKFDVEFTDAVTRQTRRETVAQVVAEKIGYFGRFLEPRSGPPLPPEQLRVVLFKTTARSRFFRYGFAQVMSQTFAGEASVQDVEVVRTGEIRCYPSDSGDAARRVRSLSEVDGELFGEIPVRVFVTDRKVRVLCPAA